MIKRTHFSRSLVTAALCAHVSLHVLSGCNGSQPLPLLSGLNSSSEQNPAKSGELQASNGQPEITASAPQQGMMQPVGQLHASTASSSAGHGGSSASSSLGKSSAGQQRLPIFTVVAEGLSPAQAKMLAASFKIGKLELEADGSVSYLDEERFQAIPMRRSPDFQTQASSGSPQMASGYQELKLYTGPQVQASLKPIPVPTAGPSQNPFDFDNEDQEKVNPEYFDFAALKALKIMPQKQALDGILIGLNQAGLMPQGRPLVGHSEFESRSVDGSESLKVQLDTQVSFEQSLGGLKLVGPGAKVKLAMDADGLITQLRYASRQLSQGSMVPVMEAAEAEKQALEMLKMEQDGDWKLASELIYYAPPLSQKVRNILPHYQIQATLQTRGGEMVSRVMLLPAIQNGLKLKLDLNQEGNTMHAKAQVEGGSAPYSYSWGSASSEIDSRAVKSAEISYELRPRQQTDKETLYLTVTDANGLTSSTRVSRPLARPELLRLRESVSFQTAMLGRHDVGIEWVGNSMGLGGSLGNAAGFVSGFAGRGVPVDFNWGDYNAWEQDFKKSSLGGNDDGYVDNVDLVFYTGHANGNGWAFPGMHDDTALQYTEASYGERELEWLMIAACGPLQPSEGGLHHFERWGRVFKGLHLLAGYATLSYDNTIEGDRLARRLLAENRTVRSAWAMMASEAQPASVVYAYMGVYGPNGVSNTNDHFWGHGPVGPDIRDVRGYWSIHAPS